MNNIAHVARGRRVAPRASRPRRSRIAIGFCLPKSNPVTGNRLRSPGSGTSSHLRVPGAGADAIAKSLTAGLEDAEFSFPARLSRTSPRHADPIAERDGSLALSIEALTIAE